MAIRIKELEDYSWFPAILRQYQMELIGMIVTVFGLYRNVANIIKTDLKMSNQTYIIDLCSGSGLPAIYIHQKLEINDLKTLLTDKYPQNVVLENGISYKQDSFDINDLNPGADNYYTMYNAFHHLSDDEQKRLIEKIIDSKSRLMIVEIVQPTLIDIGLVTFASTLGVLLICPLIKPHDWKRILFTYILPVNIITVLIDGYISVFKSISKNDYIKKMHKYFPNNTEIFVSQHTSFPTRIITIKINGTHV